MASLSPAGWSPWGYPKSIPTQDSGHRPIRAGAQRAQHSQHDPALISFLMLRTSENGKGWSKGLRPPKKTTNKHHVYRSHVLQLCWSLLNLLIYLIMICFFQVMPR